MTRQLPLILDLNDCRDKALVGGKAINLARLIQAGFPTPEAFVVTTAAFRMYRKTDLKVAGNELAAQIVAAWRAMGSPAVAVRSSATAEDLAEASMAGQYETFLGISDEQALLGAVQACWRSVETDRVRSYLREHEIEPSRVAMAVVVQRLVPADVAGVLFTADPRTGSRLEMIIEASWGLGEAVVGGKVQPDIIRVEAETGRVVKAEVADKQWCAVSHGGAAGAGHDLRPVEESRRRVQCLRSGDVLELWRLGRRAAEYFGSPQDIEWAIHDGRVYILQSRPITTMRHAEACEQAIQSARAQLRGLLAQGRGPWVIHNIAETLKHPTPLTWSVIRRFMAGDGGLGEMYRQAGFEPSPKVRGDGFLELIAGRVYMDLSLAGEMFFADYPFRYDLAEIRANPDMGQAPPSVPCGTLRQRLAAARKMAAATARMRKLAEDLDRRLEGEVFPAAAQWCSRERARDLSQVSAAGLVDLWREREKKVLYELGPQTLLPTMVAAMALADLEAFLEENFWDEDAAALANELAAGSAADLTVLANAGLWEVAQGRMAVEQWLEQHGHRAPDEFDLATPRWRERRDDAAEMARRLADAPNPLERHRRRAEESDRKLKELCDRLKRKDADELRALVGLARRYVVFRENGKHYLMLGYELLRQVALEAGRRLDIGEDVFFLSCEEMFDSLRVGFAPIHLISQRRTAYEAEAKVWLPPVIDAGAIDALGLPPQVAESADSHKAFAVSGGLAAGTARIVRRPEDAGDLGRDYVLVCPSTDPGWTPLFAGAVGLVLECGGTLSHGAVVAREMDIPAVVLPRATELLRDGETVTVDGHAGRVFRGDVRNASPAADAARGESEEIPACLMPPVPGRRDRLAAGMRRAGLIVWGIYLAAVFVLPQAWLYDPTMEILDAVLWPLVRHLGRPGAVAALAAGMAAITLLGQRSLTDNRRLREAKRRAGELVRRAAGLPKDDPRARQAGRLHMAVQMRIIGATMTPLALILGPMVMVFLWLPQRVAPEAYCAPPGSAVTVKATIDGEFIRPVVLEAGEPLSLAPETPAAQTLPPLREALEELARTWRQAGGAAGRESIPEALRLRNELQTEIVLRDLSAYLKRGIEPQTVFWKIQSRPDAAGRFHVRIRAAEGGETIVPIVLGDVYPPGPAEVPVASGGPVKAVEVLYPRPPTRQRFWTPLAVLGNEHYDPGWLLTYIAVYLPAMFALRFGLRIA